MTLKDLIPAEFYAACPRAADPTHGRLSVIRDGLPNAGKVLVEWGQKCPLFKQNLAAARELKTGGKGTYNPNAGGWVFHRNVAAEAHAKFAPTLERTAEFLALTTAPDGKELTPTAPAPGKPAATARQVHGKITLTADKRGFVVAWGNGAGFCPRDAFDRYLTAARNLKADHNPQRGWDKTAGGWVFTRNLAAYIVRQFPAANFDHCPELAADAGANPVKADPDESAPVPPDATAARWKLTAARVLAEYA